MIISDNGRRRRLEASRCRGNDDGQWSKRRGITVERDNLRGREKVTEGERRILETITRIDGCW